MFWKYINSKLKLNTGISPLNDKDGNPISTDEGKANILNDYFSSVFTKENINNLPEFELKNLQETCTEIYISVDEVKKKLQQLDPNKAQGPDKIPAKVLKELSEELALPLTVLFSKSLEKGILPSDWKKAEITAIFKKGNKTDPGNYRPVSLTCIVCKVMEQFVRDTVVQHMSDHKMYSKCQHGFRTGRSCMTQLTEVMDDFTKFIDSRETFDVDYLDFKIKHLTRFHMKGYN